MLLLPFEILKIHVVLTCRRQAVDDLARVAVLLAWHARWPRRRDKVVVVDLDHSAVCTATARLLMVHGGTWLLVEHVRETHLCVVKVLDARHLLCRLVNDDLLRGEQIRVHLIIHQKALILDPDLLLFGWLLRCVLVVVA